MSLPGLSWVPGQDVVRTFLETTEEDIGIPTYEIPA